MTSRARTSCRITRYLLVFASVAAVAAAAEAPRASYPETVSKTSDYIRQVMADKGIVGLSVALVDGENVVWKQGFGWADRERGLAVTTDTVFHIASVSKMFATTALLLLVDDGKVSLDAPVTRYIPEFRMRTGYEGITVRMLLSHQSGIPGSYYGWGFTSAPVTDYNRRMLAWFAEQYPQYQPGYVSVYANNGFTLVDEIVARVSGKSYAEFLSERIAKPLGMTQTGVDWLDPVLAAKLSKGYVGGKEQMPEYVNMLGTGGISSTPADLCRLLAMINGGGTAFGRSLLQPATVAEMNADQNVGTVVRVPQSGLAPGLGWDEYADPGLSYAAPAPAKDGSTTLFSSQIIVIPAYGLGAAVLLNNSDSTTARGIAEHILMAALEERYGVTRPPQLTVPDPTPPAFDLNTYAGQYGSVSMSGILDVRVKGDQLEIWAQQGDSLTRLYDSLSHRGSGWFAGAADPTTQFAVRQLGGKSVLIMRGSQGHYWLARAIGERLGDPPALSAAWKARLGKTWVGADLDIALYNFATLSPAIRITERGGRLVYEAYSDPQSAGGSIFDSRIGRPRVASSGNLTSGSLVLEPISDTHAWVPLQIDARDLTHIQVVSHGQEEWLRVGVVPTLWRPLDGIPQPSGSQPYTASITPEVTEWVKLPANAEFLLTVPDSVRWMLYDERLQPVYQAWGGAYRLGKPEGSDTSTLYLALYSLTPEQAVVQRLAGKTFSSKSGVLRLN